MGNQIAVVEKRKAGLGQEVKAAPHKQTRTRPSQNREDDKRHGAHRSGWNRMNLLSGLILHTFWEVCLLEFVPTSLRNASVIQVYFSTQIVHCFRV